jgi:SAM-dependent methyltransferase
MQTLDEIASLQSQTGPKTDKGSDAHDYLRFYELEFSPLRDEPIKFMEIGVQTGSSIRLWLEYFSKARVFGIDIGKMTFPVDDRYTFVQGDQSSVPFWESFIGTHGSDWDVIIDDGGHHSGQIITSFESLWPHVKPGGVYIIEDLDEAYRAARQTPGFKNHMDFLFDMLHRLNTGFFSADSLLFSEELVIIRKRKQPSEPRTPKAQLGA